MSDKPFPMQPIVWVGDVIRFRKNRIVDDLLDKNTTGLDLVTVSLKHQAGDYTAQEMVQLYQLIGVSVSYYGGLDIVEAHEEWALRPAHEIADRMHSVVDRLAEVSQPTREELEDQLAEVSADAATMAAHIYGDTMDFGIAEVAERYRAQEVEGA